MLKYIKKSKQNNSSKNKSSFNLLNENCIINILKRVDNISDLMSLRLVNRRLNAAVQVFNFY